MSPVPGLDGQSGLLDVFGDTAANSRATTGRPATPIQFLGRHPEVPKSAQDSSALRDFGTAVADAYLQAGRDMWTGYLTGASGMYNTAGNAVGLINDLNDFSLRNGGIGVRGVRPLWSAAEEWLHDASARVAPAPEDLPQTFHGKLYSTIGQAPGEFAQYLAGVRLLRPVLGIASLDALREADKGWEAAASAGAKGAALGWAAKALEPLNWIARSAGLGSVGAASTLTEGGSVESALEDGAIFGLLGAMGRAPAESLPRTTLLQAAHTEFLEAAAHARNRLDVIRGLTPRRRRQEIIQINRVPGLRLQDVARASDDLSAYRTTPGMKYELPANPLLRESRIYDYGRQRKDTGFQDIEVKRERARTPRAQRLADDLRRRQGAQIVERRENEILKRAQMQLRPETSFDRELVDLLRTVREFIRKRRRLD
jgi:hypothetical protein